MLQDLMSMKVASELKEELDRTANDSRSSLASVTRGHTPGAKGGASARQAQGNPRWPFPALFFIATSSFPVLLRQAPDQTRRMRASGLLLLLAHGIALCSAADDFCGAWKIESTTNGKARLVITHPEGDHDLLHLHETRIYDMRDATGARMGVVSENILYVQGLKVGEVLSATEFSPNVNPTCDLEHMCPSNGTSICVAVGNVSSPFAPPSPPVSPDLNFQANFVIEDGGDGRARMRLTRADGQPHGLLDQQYARLVSNTFTFADGTSPGVTSQTLMWLHDQWRTTVISTTVIEHLVTPQCNTDNSCPSTGTVEVEDGARQPPALPPTPPTPPPPPPSTPPPMTPAASKEHLFAKEVLLRFGLFVLFVLFVLFGLGVMLGVRKHRTRQHAAQSVTAPQEVEVEMPHPDPKP